MPFIAIGLWVRIAHWINALCLAILLMSGLNIFNAHPALYWGSGSDFQHPVLMLGAYADEFGMVDRGVTSIGGHEFDTTGVLGASRIDGQLTPRGFPSWATLPGPNWLAMARQWHFAFAWILVLNAIGFHRLWPVEPAFRPRSGAHPQGHRPSAAGNRRSCAAEISPWRKGQTL